MYLHLSSNNVRWAYVKKDTHPEYHKKSKITCACGNSFEVGSTAEKIEVELCSTCHPFYTGKQRLVDTAGRVERFRRRYKLTAEPTPEERAS